MDRPDWLEEGELVDYLIGHTNYGPHWRTAVVKKISQDDETCLIYFVKPVQGRADGMWVDWDQVNEHKPSTYWK